ncbi:acetyl-CoA synthetase-like protein [Mycena alexandri]|uniref:Acetyl-CoA synthetase-like protein n=1 Tax=Mycena alexandri TaxID=1745969 RepID=A0AAD6XA68_9AGAR|nr:acetyl-CoA synthetase-like protein [Mycena alexandri]
MVHFLNEVLAGFARHENLPIFKQLAPEGLGEQKTWIPITYKAFKGDIDRAAVHWLTVLSSRGFVSSDVVGLWLTGHVYTDLVHMYAICRVGFIPQLFSLSYSGADVVQDLLTTCNAKVLLFDPSFSDAVTTAITVPCIRVPTLTSIPASPLPPPALPSVEETDVAMIFHTSGTTSGKPKPIPETHRYLTGQQMQWQGVWQGKFETQDIFNQLGSFAHVGTATAISYLSVSGQCLVQTSRANFDADEFLALVKEGGVNRVFLYAPWLSNILKKARTDPQVLSVLKAMRQLIYTGASMNPEDEAWMVAQGLPATLMYASTECCLCLISDLEEREHLPAMRIISGVELEFVPTKQVASSDLTEGDGADESPLYDLFIPAYSRNCPHPTVRNRPPNGHIAGDLFQEVRPGRYIFRGRNDDWVRNSKNVAFCDTKAIEDNVLFVCSDLVRHCTVVGHNKPFVVLFVEPVVPPPSEEAATALKVQILELTAPFNARLFLHERITGPEHIVVVSSGSLSRTKEKGNIRRKAVEDEFAAILDSIYSAA